MCLYSLWDPTDIHLVRTAKRRISFASHISIRFLDFTVNQLQSTHITSGRMTAIKDARLAGKQTGWHFCLADWWSILLPTTSCHQHHSLKSNHYTIFEGDDAYLQRILQSFADARRGRNLSGGGACSILVSRLRMQHHPAWSQCPWVWARISKSWIIKGR